MEGHRASPAFVEHHEPALGEGPDLTAEEVDDFGFIVANKLLVTPGFCTVDIFYPFLLTEGQCF